MGKRWQRELDLHWLKFWPRGTESVRGPTLLSKSALVARAQLWWPELGPSVLVQSGSAAVLPA